MHILCARIKDGSKMVAPYHMVTHHDDDDDDDDTEFSGNKMSERGGPARGQVLKLRKLPRNAILGIPRGTKIPKGDFLGHRLCRVT